MKQLPLKSKEEKGLKIRFNLKQVREKNKLTQIMLITTVNKRRIRVYTKLRVEPKYWNRETYRCFQNEGLNIRERLRLKHINEQIDNLVISLYEMDERLAMKGEYLSDSTVRQVVDEHQQKEHLLQNPIACLKRLVGEYEKSVNRKGRRGIESTKATYLTALGRLEDYDRQRKVPICSFDDFNKKFFVDFTNYLYGYSYGKSKKHYTQNTIINTLKVIKNLLHRAYDNEMTTNNYFLKVQTTLPSDSSEQIYLQEKEIQKLSLVKTENDEEHAVRDAFIIACYTALRISDIQQLNKATVRKGVISLYQKKTKELVEIPILKEIAPLITYYQQVGFPVIDKVKANRTIKALAARCGINESVSRKEFRGGETTIVTIPKYELISFHTARRSCVTNLYKRGYPVSYVMSLSGHRSFQAFQRYMRASSKELMSDFVRLLRKEKAILA
jgi:integrase